MLTRNVLLLTGSIAIIGANSLVLSPVAASVAKSFVGIDAANVMTASAIYGLSTAVSALTLASTADRIGAERALLYALLVLSVALMGAASSPTLIVLCAAQALAGLAAGVALPAIYTLAAQIAEKGRESETLGVVLTGWTLSLVAGVSLSAVLADIVHWRAVFSLLAAASVGLAVAIGGSRNWGTAARADMPTSPFTALRVPGIVPVLLNVAAYMTAFYGLYSYLGPHLGVALRLPATFAGVAICAYGVGFGVAAPLGRLVDRYGTLTAATAAFAGLTLTYLGLAASAGHVFILMLCCVAWGVANHIGLNLLVRRLTQLDPQQRGAIMGLYSAITYFCVFVGALAYRPIFEQLGFAACALLSAACVVPALIGSFRRSSPDIVHKQL
ncbi:Predicted arabinose efflux permease, MFS family [Modicisalibacter muralis]|uniref:Predicted arabinose efflux permease, MFS family n=1 Tax=Modicisalibacter muralis TaxID=119000 RepID=A0A1G9I2K9_9GAMM|nr:MFS transporter [Halomonas muralis]SDL19478.1 Predicted arabinose efflux permease, MFS family [Halomonas muralis]